MTSPAPPRSASQWLVAAGCAALLVALGDVIVTVARSTTPVPAGAFLIALAAAIGLYGMAALPLGLAQAVLADSMRACLGDEYDLAWLRRRLADRPFDLRLATGLLASFVVVAALAAATYLFLRYYAVEMANKRNTALSTALFLAVALPLLSPLFFPACRWLSPLVRALPPPRTLWTLGLATLIAGLAGVLALLSVDWRIIHFGALKVLSCFVLLQVLFVHLLRKRMPSFLLGLRLPAKALLAAVLLGAIAITLARFGPEPRSRALIAEEMAGTKRLLSLAQRLGDRDHDGYSGILGGGDCDDQDAAVHPGAEDIPGDGIDQDCEGGDEAPGEAARPKAPAPDAPGLARWEGNWLILTIDTLRADRVGPKLTPNLLRVAQRGVHFLNAYSQAPNTPRSFPSFVTSRFPSQVHYVRKSLNFSPVTGEDPTLFTALSAAGYRTIGIFSHFYMEERTGLSKGFDEWDNHGAKTLHDSNSDIAAPRITERVVRRLAALGDMARQERKRGLRPRPFTLWTHLFDPHSTYMDHPEFPVAGKGFRYLAARYDAEVAFTDLHVGRILDALDRAGLTEDTALLIFSDHGEAFGEHRLGGEPLYFHGETLYDEVLRVPVILSVPGVLARTGITLPDRIMLIDLAPTVLSLSHVPVPPQFMGRSLVPVLSGGVLPAAPAYAEMLPCTSWQYNQRVLISGDYKLYAKFTENIIELYNLKEDPTEKRNLAQEQPQRTAALRHLLSAYMRGRP